jgi:hypothetical protein
MSRCRVWAVLQSQPWRPQHFDTRQQKLPEVQHIVMRKQLVNVDEGLAVAYDGINGLKSFLLFSRELLQRCNRLQRNVLVGEHVDQDAFSGLDASRCFSADRKDEVTSMQC